jgi:hypothetical protein
VERAVAKPLGTFFRHIVCINLDRRPDRWSRMRHRFEQSGLETVHRFPAVDGREHAPPHDWPYSAGAYGCLRSHVEVVRMARDRGWANLLILEDDVVFDPRLEERFGAQLGNLPGDWDALLLGGIHLRDPLPLEGDVVRLTSTLSTFAYALRDRAYDAFLALHGGSRIPVDEGNRELQATRRVYGVSPCLAWVEDDYSDIGERRINHWWAEKSLVLDGREFVEAAREVVVLLPFDNRTAGDDWGRGLGTLVRSYARLSTELVVAVIVHGDGPSPELQDLPENVGVQRAAGVPRADRMAALEAGYQEWVATRSRFMLADIATSLSQWDLKSCILMSRRHDVVRCARSAVELNELDTCKALAGRLREIDVGPYEHRPFLGPLDGVCILNRRAMQLVDWSSDHLRLRRPGLAALSSFQAPGWSYQHRPRVETTSGGSKGVTPRV